MIAGGLLAAYDAQLRGIAETGDDVERDGPLVRRVLPSGGFVSYRDLDGIRGPDLDALIARQVAHFAGLGLTFEWKTRGHDEPWDLGERLVRAGLVAGPRETVMVGEAGEMPAERPLPDGVTLREARDDADLDRIAAMELGGLGRGLELARRRPAPEARPRGRRRGHPGSRRGRGRGRERRVGGVLAGR